MKIKKQQHITKINKSNNKNKNNNNKNRIKIVEYHLVQEIKLLVSF